MARISTNIFKPASRPRPTSLGAAGYDNARENIDPHIKTKVVSTKEGSVEKVPTEDSDITNKKYVDDKFPVTHASTTGQTTDDHHVRYTDAEAITSMGAVGLFGPALLAGLAGYLATTSKRVSEPDLEAKKDIMVAKELEGQRRILSERKSGIQV